MSSRNVAVVLPNWIGDVVMATPALRAIRAGLTRGDRLIGVGRPYVADVLQGTSFLDDLVLYDKKAADPAQRWWNVAFRLRRDRLDQAILLPNSLSSAALGWLAGAKERIGYARYGRGMLLTGKLYPPQENGKRTPISAVDYYLSLVEKAGYQAEGRHCQLATTPGDDSIARRLWQQFGFFDRRVIVFNTGGAYGQAKHWPVESYVELAKRLVEDPRNAVWLICGPGEKDTVYGIERQVSHPRVRSLAAEKPSLGLSKAVIRHADLMVTTDSGPRHFAAAYAVPTVTLFGPTDPRWAENYNPRELILTAGVDCSPCAKRECPLGHHRCMRDLRVEDVHRAVGQQLNWQPHRQAA